jgi:hypothetical protein
MNLFWFFSAVLLSILSHSLSSVNQNELSYARSLIGNRSSGPPRVLLVIPGLGRADRLETVINNVQLLVQQQKESLQSNQPFILTCVIYVYASRMETEFWSNDKKISFLQEHCQLIENPGKKVTENMFMIQPVYLKESFDYVFLLLDDCRIKDDKTFLLSSMIQLMQCNELSVLSPLVSTLLHFVCESFSKSSFL